MDHKNYLTEDEAQKLFYDLKEFNIDFETNDPILKTLKENNSKPVTEFIFEGCFARTEAQVRFMQAKGIKSKKSWIFSPDFFLKNSTNSNFIKTKNPYKRFLSPSKITYEKIRQNSSETQKYDFQKKISFGFHVTPVANIKIGDEIIPHIFDPTLADKPITYKEQEKQFDSNTSILRVDTELNKSFTDKSSEFFGNWKDIENNPVGEKTLNRFLKNDQTETDILQQSFRPAKPRSSITQKEDAFKVIAIEMLNLFKDHSTAQAKYKLTKKSTL